MTVLPLLTDVERPTWPHVVQTNCSVEDDIPTASDRRSGPMLLRGKALMMAEYVMGYLANPIHVGISPSRRTAPRSLGAACFGVRAIEIRRCEGKGIGTMRKYTLLYRV